MSFLKIFGLILESNIVSNSSMSPFLRKHFFEYVKFVQDHADCSILDAKYCLFINKGDVINTILFLASKNDHIDYDNIIDTNYLNEFPEKLCT